MVEDVKEWIRVKILKIENIFKVKLERRNKDWWRKRRKKGGVGNKMRKKLVIRVIMVGKVIDEELILIEVISKI